MFPKMPEIRDEAPPVRREVPKFPNEESEDLAELPKLGGNAEEGEGKGFAFESQDLS